MLLGALLTALLAIALPAMPARADTLNLPLCGDVVDSSGHRAAGNCVHVVTLAK